MTHRFLDNRDSLGLEEGVQGYSLVLLGVSPKKSEKNMNERLIPYVNLIEYSGRLKSPELSE